jgi:DNA sulfur modification protein DndD
VKFHRVIVDNWRPFKGASTMDLAATDDRPVTLVFGKNGGGKTSMLTAIYWCLYGTMDLEEGKGAQNLVNDHAVQESNASKDDPAVATVVLFASKPNNGTEYLYRISRSQKAYDSGGARIEATEPLRVDRVTPDVGYRPGDDVEIACRNPGAVTERYEGRTAQDVVEKLLPQNLARYFFYPGETLSFPFRNDKDSIRSLKGFLREISGGSKFEPFRDMIKDATKRLDSKSRAHAEADKETKRLQEDINELAELLAQNEASLPNLEAELDAAEGNLSAVVAQLQELDSLQDVLAAAERARAEEKAAQLRVEVAEQALTDALSQAYLIVAGPVFDAVSDVFSKRKYPNDISSSLVQQLKDSMVCICGRDLDAEMFRLLEPLSPNDDSVIARMHTLHSHATSLRRPDSERRVVDQASVNLRTALDGKKAAIESRADAEAKLSEAGAEEFQAVDKENLVANRAHYDRSIRELAQRLGALQQSISDSKAEIERKEAQKRSSAPKSHQEVHAAARIAHQMGELLEAIADKQADVARRQLQSLINENYVVYKQNIEVAVDSDLRVKVIDKTGEVHIEKPVGDLSGAETALLTYAFAAAAAKLLPQYQTLDKLLTTTPVFAEVENIPLVVDAPFSNLGHEYKRRVTDLMARGFSQVVMFTEAADTDVLEEFAGVIGAEYLVHFYGALADGVERDFKWRGTTHVYASPTAGRTRSALERIEA